MITILNRMWRDLPSQLAAAVLGLLLSAAACYGQSAPPTLPDHTVFGRLGSGTGSGPGQAIPFATLGAQIGASLNTPSYPNPISGAVTLNVDHTNGVDQKGCGFATSGSAACKTIYYAYQVFQTNILVANPAIQATIQSDCGFTETPPQEFIGPVTGNGLVFILGNPSSPATCSWTSAGVSAGLASSIHIEGFETINAGSNQTWLTVAKTSVAITKNMVWGPATSGSHIQIFDDGVYIVDNGGTEQVGVASCAPSCFSYHVINNGGTFEESNQTISVPSALTFTAWYSGTNSGANYKTTGLTFTGTGAGSGSTGQPYNISQNASLKLQGSTLPGSSGSSVNAGACDDNGCVPGAVLSFSGTPACTAATEGAITTISDSTVNAVGAQIAAGSGPYDVVASCKSTVWRVLGVRTALGGLASGSNIVGVVFASLPTPATGMIAYITDGKSSNCGDTACTTFGTTITGGSGSLKLLSWYNGTNWTLIGK